MKTLLVVLGTRGDVEPFLSVGEKLAAEGHEVRYCLPAQLGHLVPQRFDWTPLDPGFLEMLDGPDGRALMSGYLPPLAKIRAVSRLARQGIDVNRTVVQQQIQSLEDWNPEQVICHPKCSVPLLWALQNGRRFAFLSPIPFYVHEDPRQPHTGFNGSFGAFFNRLTYRLINLALSVATWDSARKLSGLRRLTVPKIYREIQRAKFLFAVSPSLYGREPSWGPNVQILGHSTRDNSQKEPDPRLLDFLARHDRVLVLTFGSMTSAQPERASQVIYECLRAIGCPVVVILASGGLIRLPEFEDDTKFCFVETVSYPDLLPHANAIIHHGGSGTTHLGLKFGCPTLVIPHIFDQFTWGGLIASLGVGPAPVAVNKLRAKDLTTRIRDLLENPRYHHAALRIASAMKSEQNLLDLSAFLEAQDPP